MNKLAKRRKMGAAMNYDVIWNVGDTRRMARDSFARELKRPGRSHNAVEREIERRLKDGSLSIRRCTVRVQP